MHNRKSLLFKSLYAKLPVGLTLHRLQAIHKLTDYLHITMCCQNLVQFCTRAGFQSKIRNCYFGRSERNQNSDHIPARNQIPLQHYLKLKWRNAASLLTETQNAFL